MKNRFVDQVLHNDDGIQRSCHTAGIGITIEHQAARGAIDGIHHLVDDQLPCQEIEGVSGIKRIGGLGNIDPMKILLGKCIRLRQAEIA